MTRYVKPPLTSEEHVALWRDRGLTVPDHDRARQCLRFISYYRLSAYTRHFYIPDSPAHRFIPGTRFDAVLDLYEFDRQLRLLILDAIERLEVAIRTQLTNTIAEHHGPYGYLNAAIFNTRYNHERLLKTLEEKSGKRDVETFLKHYREHYPASPAQPPIWMATELLTFGEVSTLLSNLRKPEDTQRMETAFGFKYPVLESWFRSLSDLRNLCAHHSRVWNREFGSRPAMPSRIPDDWMPIPATLPPNGIQPQRRLYMQIVVILSLLKQVSPDSLWKNRFLDLLEAFSEIPTKDMGFAEGFQNHPFWERLSGGIGTDGGSSGNSEMKGGV